MEDDGTVTLMIRLSQVSSMPFQVTVNETAVGKYTVLYGGLILRQKIFIDEIHSKNFLQIIFKDYNHYLNVCVGNSLRISI